MTAVPEGPTVKKRVGTPAGSAAVGSGTGQSVAIGLAVVLTVLLIVVFVLVAGALGMFSWQNVVGSQPSPNDLTVVAWLIIMAGAVAGLTTLRLTRRIFALAAPGPIAATALGMAIGGVPAGIWVSIYTSSTSGMTTSFGAVVGRLVTVLLSLACAIALVAARRWIRLVGGSLLGSSILLMALVFATLTARTGTVRLGLLELGITPAAEVAPTYFSVRFLIAAIVAVVPAVTVAWIGRRRDQPWGEAAIAGAIGPFVVGIAYLLAGNGVITDADRFRPWLYVQASAVVALLLAALVARLTDRDGHLAAPPLPRRFRWWGVGAAAGVVGGMVASMLFFNLGPIPFSATQASEQVTGTLRSYDGSVLVSATLTLIGLAVTVVVAIEAVWSLRYGGRDFRRTSAD